MEFALLMPLLFALLLALVRIGLIGRDAMLVLQAARAGAREAAVSSDEAAIRSAVLEGGAGLEAERISFDLVRDGLRGYPVTMHVTYDADTGFAWGWLPESVRLEARAVMRQEFG